jgi:hypothetical protein
LILLPVFNGYAQSRQVRRAINKQEKKKEEEDRNYQKKRKKVLKHRFDIQTKEVQDRIKLSGKKSNQYNKAKEEPFFSGLLNKKRKKSR